MITKKHPYTYRDCGEGMIAELLVQGLEQVRQFAQARGYRQAGDFPSAALIHAGVQGATPTLKKRLLKQTEGLQRKTNLRIANRFLRLLCTRLLAYPHDAQVARVEISEREAAIRLARKAWLKAGSEAEGLRLAYVNEKGDFYRRSV